jgi:ubiquitin-conjugating enzyme E2 H
MYPNPTDPLNSAAAAIMLKNREVYEQKVREHVRQHAKMDVEPEDVSDIDRDDLSELSDTSDLDPELL